MRTVVVVADLNLFLPAGRLLYRTVIIEKGFLSEVPVYVRRSANRKTAVSYDWVDFPGIKKLILNFYTEAAFCKRQQEIREKASGTLEAHSDDFLIPGKPEQNCRKTKVE